MIYDLQKAMIWKRASAYLFDFIILGIVVVGIAFGMSGLTGYDAYSEILETCYARYEQEYGTTFDLTEEDYHAMTPREQQIYAEAYEALTADETAMHAYSMMVNLTLLITSLSTLAGYLILEFAVPLLLGNGQTLGKKIFGVGVIRPDGVRISTVQLFIRTVLGKYTIETMLPVLLVMMIFFGIIGLPGTIVVVGLVLTQAILLLVHRNHAVIHDLLANTVAVDLSSQMVFDTEQDMIEYKKKISAEQAARQSY